MKIIWTEIFMVLIWKNAIFTKFLWFQNYKKRLNISKTADFKLSMLHNTFWMYNLKELGTIPMRDADVDNIKCWSLLSTTDFTTSLKCQKPKILPKLNFVTDIVMSLSPLARNSFRPSWNRIIKSWSCNQFWLRFHFVNI